MSRKQALDKAKLHIFSTGVGDAASSLCRWNMSYGLAKFHYVQEKYGIPSNATFISTPDETITRNRVRWNFGVGYGGKISWGEGEEKVIILDVMPNACGLLVGGLDDFPKPSELIDALASIKEDEKVLDNIRLQWDFDKGNHFINVYRVVKAADVELPNYAFIIHSSAPELKKENEKGPGLYVHSSRSLRDMADRVETPFGPSYVLTENDAKEYYEHYRYAESFAKRKRSLIARGIFGSYKELANVTHQGLVNYNEACLGCHHINPQKSGEIYPIALRGDLPAYLLSGKPNFTADALENLGFAKRAERLGVLHRLENANILPHGGGYTFPDMLSVIDVIETGSSRFFVIEMSNGIGLKIVSDVDGLEFTYRGREVLVKTIELGMAKIIARLIPVYVLKA